MTSIAPPPWAVIPVKSFAAAKSRLGLDAIERARIARGFLEHVLSTVCAAIPAHQVLVVSHEEAALELARAAGARALREIGTDGLNPALAQAARFAQARGALSVLSVFSDLPWLEIEDIEAMMHAFTGENLVLAPDEEGTGTNAVLMPPGLIPYRHGQASLWRHVEAVRRCGRPVTLVRRPGLMRDIDTPAALATLASSNARPPRNMVPHHD